MRNIFISLSSTITTATAWQSVPNFDNEKLTWYRLRILETQPWETLNWRLMTQGRTPAAASSTIFNRMWFGSGLPLMKTPPNWLTLPWPGELWCIHSSATGNRCMFFFHVNRQQEGVRQRWSEGSRKRVSWTEWGDREILQDFFWQIEMGLWYTDLGMDILSERDVCSVDSWLTCFRSFQSSDQAICRTCIRFLTLGLFAVRPKGDGVTVTSIVMVLLWW